MRDQLVGRGHVDAIDIWKAHRRRGTGKINFSGSRIARHLHNFAAGSAPHDGVIHQQHIAALELAGNHIELLPYRFFAHGLAGHDESAAYVAVFDKSFAVR